MDTQLSKFSILRMTSPKNGDLCHSAFVSCDTISSERIAPPLTPDPAALRGRLGEGRAQNALPAGYRVHHRRAGEANR
jgi:hypothetical protein